VDDAGEAKVCGERAIRGSVSATRARREGGTTREGRTRKVRGIAVAVDRLLGRHVVS